MPNLNDVDNRVSSDQRPIFRILIDMRIAPDIQIAITVLLFSLAGATSSIPLLRETQSAQHHQVAPALKAGTQQFELRSGATCFGTVTATLEEGPEVALQFFGIVRAFGMGQPIDATLRSSLAFNALGQLIASETRLSIPDREVKIQTKNVRPIKVLITLPAGVAAAIPPLELPGPLELKESRGMYTLTHPLSDSLSNSYANNWVTGLISGLNFTVIAPQTGVVAEACTKDRIDLGQIGQSFSSVLQFLK